MSNINLPEQFKTRMKEYLEVSYEAFIASYETSEVKGIRLSSFFRGDGPFAMESLPLSVESVNGQLESGAKWQKVVWCDNGYFLNADDFNEKVKACSHQNDEDCVHVTGKDALVLEDHLVAEEGELDRLPVDS